LNKERVVFIDVETTGLDPAKGHRIIEIGAIAMENNQTISEFQSLVQVSCPIPRHVSKIHGITNALLAGQPIPEQIYPEFKHFISDSLLIAHNAKFDVGFLRSEFSRLNLRLQNPNICTLEMIRRRYPGLPNYKLSTVYQHLVGMAEDMFRSGDVMRKPKGSASCPRKNETCFRKLQQHRALDDARMVAAIWMAMEEKIDE
jgi:DNA polymerase-3 subunit epsilon